MNARAALCASLLAGRVLTGKNIQAETSYTNISREIIRGVERPFNVTVSRVKKESKSRYGQHIFWYEYRLNKSEHNSEGIKEMITYVKENMPKVAKTIHEERIINDFNKILSAYKD
jgi:hypothetical protein